MKIDKEHILRIILVISFILMNVLKINAQNKYEVISRK